MIDVTHTVTIDRPVNEVFDFVAESSNEPKWDVDVQKVIQPTQGPLTAGTRYEWVLKLLGTKRIAGEVTAFETNRLIELTTIEGPILPKITHTFEAEGDRTIYARRIRFETGGLLKLLEPFMKLMPRNPNTRTAENLKLVLEGGQAR
jgi:ligand-binding SRPBCC domain-containing protein